MTEKPIVRERQMSLRLRSESSIRLSPAAQRELVVALAALLRADSFIETQLFTRLVSEYLSEQEYVDLQQALIDDPEAGDVVPGSGGVRKLRWGAPDRGKRSGYRVIYFVRQRHGIIWMLTMYPKNVTDLIPAHVLRQIRKEN